jgi:hypothetical protein
MNRAGCAANYPAIRVFAISVGVRLAAVPLNREDIRELLMDAGRRLVV